MLSSHESETPSRIILSAHRTSNSSWPIWDSTKHQPECDVPFIAERARAFEVRDSFPRLTPVSVPSGIIAATYSLNLDQCLDFEIPFSQVLETMNLDEFRKEILENVSAQAAANQEFRHSAFVEHCLRLLEDADEVADVQTCFYRGTGSKNRNSGIDAYSFDEADGSVRLFIGDFGGTDEIGSLTQSDAKAWFSRIQTFCEDSFSGKLTRETEESAPAYALASLLHQNQAAITRMRLYLLSDSLISTRIRDLPETIISGKTADLHIWDVSRFFRVFESRTGRDDLEVDFNALFPGGLQCIRASVDSTQYQAYLCVIPGDALAAIYETYGSRLLEGNVRSFLTVSGKVNKGIRNTILQRPDMFFAFNNGIACTASSVEVSNHGTGLRILKAADLQIVNGGQTTASLASALGNDRASLKSVFVQMKLSVVAPEQAGEVIPEISRCANSQNKVSEADFFSNHEFHRRIEQISRRLWAPAAGGAQYETHWFYERARGQYLNEQSRLTAAERRSMFCLTPDTKSSQKRIWLNLKMPGSNSRTSSARAPRRISCHSAHLPLRTGLATRISLMTTTSRGWSEKHCFSTQQKSWLPNNLGTKADIERISSPTQSRNFPRWLRSR